MSAAPLPRSVGSCGLDGCDVPVVYSGRGQVPRYCTPAHKRRADVIARRAARAAPRKGPDRAAELVAMATTAVELEPTTSARLAELGEPADGRSNAERAAAVLARWGRENGLRSTLPYPHLIRAPSTGGPVVDRGPEPTELYDQQWAPRHLGVVPAGPGAPWSVPPGYRADVRARRRDEASVWLAEHGHRLDGFPPLET